ncbi:PilW family protein [Candidatus Omnitrophota bacterium]
MIKIKGGSGGLSLLELIVALSLFSLIVFGFGSLDLFSHFHMITSDRRATIQNDVSFVLEHMAKEISRAIGNEMVYGPNTVVNYTSSNDLSVVAVYIDGNGNGQREPGNTVDFWVGYEADLSQNQIGYCSQCTEDDCIACASDWEVLSSRITAFTITRPDPPENNIEAQLTACWDPLESQYQCGTSDNPSISMSNRIKMQSVATN